MNGALTLEQARELTDRLLTAIAAGDVATIRNVYAPDAVIRNNYSAEVTPIGEFINQLGLLRSVVARMWFEPIRLQVTEIGFVDEHIAHFRTTGGASIELMSCLVAEVRDGRIVDLTDYANSADLAPLNAEVMAHLAEA